tara:strand:+ start:4564 stop:5640 length:1077 start_codon:yes stop_codon:yes gene_type:complete
MHISRGGFKSRTHNIVLLTYKGHSFFSEVIGDSELIRFLFLRLFNYLKENKSIKNFADLYEGVKDWIDSFVYLEPHSSVNSIGCAFDWLRVIVESYYQGSSIFDILSIPNPKRKFTKVYGSNLYWKASIDEFKKQIDDFDFSQTSILKFHLGRMAPGDEYKYYEVIDKCKNIREFMIDLNCGYNLNQLKELSNYLDSSDNLRKKLLWLEEPTYPDLSNQWKNNTSLNLAAGENHHGTQQLSDLLSYEIDWIMPDFGRTLSLSDFPTLWKKINKNASISFHSYSSGFLAYLSLLVSTVIPLEKTLYEHDFSENALLTDITNNALYIKDGYAYIDPNALHDLNLDKIDDSWTCKTISMES